MFKFFRRKKDDKSLSGMAEQQLSTLKKMEMVEKAKAMLEKLHSERRLQIIPVEFDRRRA